MLEALIFDVDGTLADTEAAHRVAFNEAFAQAGLDWHWDEATYIRLLQVAGGKERMAHHWRMVDPDTARSVLDGVRAARAISGMSIDPAHRPLQDFREAGAARMTSSTGRYGLPQSAPLAAASR